ncbi:unnamed protein product [Schistosoma curassoni]|uniref:Uncharacterized protein n=1 Tax=Schistosoma curassoni TaxID=6186 RepID=A0A183K8W8_9TREM|nr:unnamed protein product [Schistosoma curassoni]
MSQNRSIEKLGIPVPRPSSQLQEFQEFNKPESIQKRARDLLSGTDPYVSHKDEKIRRIMPFDRERPLIRSVPQSSKSSFLPEEKLPNSELVEGDENPKPTSLLRSHPYRAHPGTCSVSETLDGESSRCLLDWFINILSLHCECSYFLPFQSSCGLMSVKSV